VPGYAANTAQNVAAGPTVAPVSLATDLAIATIFAVVGVTVYLLLRRIDRRAAGRRVVFAAVAAGMILVNLAFHHAALLFAAGPGSTAVGAQNSDGLVVLLLGMHDHGYTITGAFFGLWLLALGHLAYQSSLFPRVLSTLLIVSLILGWLVGFGWPGLPTVVHTILAPAVVADLGWSPTWSPRACPLRCLTGAPPRRSAHDAGDRPARLRSR
jgi:hypothetical protein